MSTISSRLREQQIRITVAGCGDAFSSGGRFHTCFYVEAPAGTFLIDCGATSVAALKRQQLPLDTIDTVLISHFHGDHYGGLPYLLLEAAVAGRTRPVTIVSPPGGKKKVTELLELLYPGSAVLEKLSVRFLEFAHGETKDDLFVDAGYLRIRAFPVTHVAAACPHGLRIETAGKLLAFSGDSSWDPNLMPLAEQADLFICDCNFYDTRSEAHLDYQSLNEVMEQLTCKKILLTHFSEEMLRHIGDITLPCAEEGKQIILPV